MKAEVCLTSGVLVLDGTVLDKPYARKLDLVHHMWSGKYLAVVKGIDLLTQLYTAGERRLPCDYRIYDKPNDGKTKNNYFGNLIDTAKERRFQPEYLLFDSWYISLVDLKKMNAVGGDGCQGSSTTRG